MPKVTIKGIATTGETSDLLIKQLKKCDNIDTLQLERIRFHRGLSSVMSDIQNINEVSLVDCSYNRLLDEDGCGGLSRKSNVTGLNIGNRLEVHGSQDLLGNVLSFQFPHLRVLNLSNCNLSGDNLAPIVHCHENKYFPCLTELYLDKNPKLSGSFPEILKSVWTSLEIFHAVSCNLSVIDIQSVLQNYEKQIPKWKQITLFSDPFLQSWFDNALHKRPQGEWSTSISKTFMVLAEALANEGYLKFLTSLTLGRHSEIFEAQLFQWELLKLTTIELSDCGITPTSCATIGKANEQGHLPSVRVLNLSYNPELSGAIYFLMKGTWSSLLDLNLASCNLKGIDICALANANRAQSVNHLQIFSLNDNPGISNTLYNLQDSKWENMQQLELKHCNLSVEDYKLLFKMKFNGFAKKDCVIHVFVRDNMQREFESLLDNTSIKKELCITNMESNIFLKLYAAASTVRPDVLHSVEIATIYAIEPEELPVLKQLLGHLWPNLSDLTLNVDFLIFRDTCIILSTANGQQDLPMLKKLLLSISLVSCHPSGERPFQSLCEHPWQELSELMLYDCVDDDDMIDLKWVHSVENKLPKLQCLIVSGYRVDLNKTKWSCIVPWKCECNTEGAHQEI